MPARRALVAVFGALGLVPLSARAASPDGQAVVLHCQQFVGGTAGRHFASAVSAAGDVDGDGFGDLVVGARRVSEVNLFHGSGAGLVDTATVRLESAGSTIGFGYSVASAGDTNGDGFDEVVIGEQYGPNAYLFLGSRAGVPSTPSATLSLDAGKSLTLDPKQAQVKVAGGGDLDGDGLDDVVVASTAAAVGGTMRTPGAAVVFSGRKGKAAPVPSVVLEGEVPEGLFGWAMDIAGDLNGDGLDDLVIGSPRNTTEGSVAIYYGRKGGISTKASAWLRGPTGGMFGAIVKGLGDVNGDGFDDLGVFLSQSAFSSVVGVYYGGPEGLSASPDRVLAPGRMASVQGFDGIGDINSDGLADVAVFAQGELHVYMGGDAGLTDGPQASTQTPISNVTDAAAVPIPGTTGSFVAIIANEQYQQPGASEPAGKAATCRVDLAVRSGPIAVPTDDGAVVP